MLRSETSYGEEGVSPLKAGGVTESSQGEYVLGRSVDQSLEAAFVELEMQATRGSVYGILNGSELPTQNLYENPLAYDVAYPGFPGDIEFYGSRLSQGSVLYAGVGSGRVFSKMSEINPSVQGLDISGDMLEQLLRKFPNANKNNLILGDVRSCPGPDEEYDQVIAPYAFLNVFSTDDLKRAVKSIASKLKPNGQFLTDLFSPFQNPPYDQHYEVFKDDTNESGVRVLIEIFYNHVRQILLEVAYTEDANGNQTLTHLPNYFYYPNELRGIFTEAGFDVDLYGGYDMSQLNEESEPLVIMATKK